MDARLIFLTAAINAIKKLIARSCNSLTFQLFCNLSNDVIKFLFLQELGSVTLRVHFLPSYASYFSLQSS